MSRVYIIIPARYQSERLPGKPLQLIGDAPMIQHVYQNAKRAEVEEVIVATDDARILMAVESFGGKVCMTASTHQSGTERIAEVIEKQQLDDDDIIVNLQGDEPLLPFSLINQTVNNLRRYDQAAVATLCEPIESPVELFSTQVNKVVRDHEGYAIYFSRAPIPWYRHGFAQAEKIMPSDYVYYRHIGLYVYRAGFVKRYVRWAPCVLEKIEALEQLRVLWYGEKIHVDIAREKAGIGVDTPEDLARVRRVFSMSRAAR